MIGHGADPVHLPRIFVQLNARGLRHSLAFFDQLVQQMAEVGELRFVGESAANAAGPSERTLHSPTN